MSVPVLSRRSAVRGFLVVVASGVAGYLVARDSDAAKAKRITTAANGYGPAPAAGGRRLAELADVPVGGGVVESAAGVVLTRDASGEVHGFSATCTHQGCTVNAVRDGAILCPCHGSRFDARTGAPIAGPATRPLPEIPVVVRGGAVLTA